MPTSTSASEGRWIMSDGPIVPSRLKLFCFPFAGGGASVLRQWAKLFPPEVQVCLIQYPGKESRILEAPVRQLMLLADAAAQALLPYIHSPYAFFGHSMGAIVAFEVSTWLRRKGFAGPDLFIASGSLAPHARRNGKTRFDLPQVELIDELRRLAGSPPEVLNNADLLQILFPAIRADFEAIETYRYDGQYEPSACPMVAIGGVSDPDIGAQQLDEWNVQTTGNFHRHLVAGGHFFLLDHPQTVVDLIMSYLAQFMAEPSCSLRLRASTVTDLAGAAG